MKMRKEYSAAGFTLIEVIVTLVVLALAVAMMATYFGTAISGSADPIGRLINSTNQTSAQQIMEKITVEYSRIPHWHSKTVYAAGAVVIPTTPNANGYQYICTAGGTSNATVPAVEPSWPIPIPGGPTTVTDGGITWTLSANCAPILSGDCSLSPGCTCSTDLQSLIGTEGTDINNAFGNYHVVQNRFIEFDGTNQEVISTPSSNLGHYGRYLKVEITDLNSPTSTRAALFVLR